MNQTATRRFEVGQQVFVSWSGRRGNNSHCTISKVGTKWATLDLYGDRYRFDIKTLSIDGDGYSSPGTIYMSEGDYIQEMTLNNLWWQFRGIVADRNNTPKEITADAIRTAAKALGITLKE